VRDRIATVGARTAYIEPGSPWENGSCESFNARLRDELLLALKADKLSAARSSTASARPGSSSRIGDGTTTRHRNAHLAILLKGIDFLGLGQVPRGL
jgi:transposase InsO family protein